MLVLSLGITDSSFSLGVGTSQMTAEDQLKYNCFKAGLTFHGDTPTDGNCFFHAVSHQLSLLGHHPKSAAELRYDVVRFLRSHPQIMVSMLHFLENEYTDSIVLSNISVFCLFVCLVYASQGLMLCKPLLVSYSL